jgi:hypothetical protein
MPDIAFHLSSETADANGHCPGGDRTKITLPLEPALQIPIDAKPVAWLHNLAFSNAIANVSTSDGSDSLVLGTGDGACNFNKGDYPGTNAWIGIRYKASDGTQCGLVAPLTKEHGMSAGFDDTFNVEYTGIAATLDGMSIAQVYRAINNAFSHALNSPTYATKSTQNKTGMNSPGAAILDNGKIKVIVPPLPGSTGGDVLTYNGVTTSGNNVTIDVTPRGYVAGKTDALTTALNTSELQLMTTQQINDTISHVINDGVAADAYSSAVSIFDALGGGPLAGTTAWDNRNSFGGTEALISTGFGLYADATSDLNISLPVACYTLDGMERAIARQAKADSTFWAAVTSHQPHGTQLADPDIDAQWKAATNDAALAASGTVYTRIVQLIADTEQNRAILQCAPQVQVVSGGLMTTVLGFDATQLGTGTSGASVTATAPDGNQIQATNAARVDRVRAVVFHAPTLCAGSYSTAGKQGGSALAMVPITAPVGDVQSWEASVPIRVPAGVAGTSLNHITVYLASEDGEQINLIGDRWSAQLILSY